MQAMLKGSLLFSFSHDRLRQQAVSPVLSAIFHSPAHNTDLMINACVIVVLSKNAALVPVQECSMA